MGVLDKFLDAIKLNDDYDDDGFLDDDLLDEEEDDEPHKPILSLRRKRMMKIFLMRILMKNLRRNSLISSLRRKRPMRMTLLMK